MKNIILTIIMLVLGLFASCNFTGRRPNKADYLNEEPPGLTAKIFAEGIVSTGHYEHGSPAFSPAYDEVYWGVRIDQEPGREIIKCVKKVQTGWSEPAVASFSIMGKGDLYPAFFRDGKEIYFTSDRSGPSNPDIANRCIWKVRKEGNGWSDPELVGFDSLDIYGCSISQTGALYFMAQHVEDRGTMKYDIYCSAPENGGYGRPKKIGDPISTEHFEDGPFISKNEKFMLLESNRPGGIGRNDIYLSMKTEHGTWTEPRNLGSRVNSESSERFAYISPDGKYLFFGSDRNGNYDIYWISASVIDSVIHD
jgi:hypothetical protein